MSIRARTWLSSHPHHQSFYISDLTFRKPSGHSWVLARMDSSTNLLRRAMAAPTPSCLLNIISFLLDQLAYSKVVRKTVKDSLFCRVQAYVNQLMNTCDIPLPHLLPKANTLTPGHSVTRWRLVSSSDPQTGHQVSPAWVRAKLIQRVGSASALSLQTNNFNLSWILVFHSCFLNYLRKNKKKLHGPHILG